MTVWLERSLDCGFSASRTIGFKFMSLMPYLFSAHFSAETGEIGSNSITAHSQQNVLRIGHTNVASFQGMRSIDGRVAWQGIANPSRLGRRVMGPAQKRLCRGRQIRWGFAEGVLNGLLRCFRVFRRCGCMGQSCHHSLFGSHKWVSLLSCEHHSPRPKLIIRMFHAQKDAKGDVVMWDNRCTMYCLQNIRSFRQMLKKHQIALCDGLTNNASHCDTVIWDNRCTMAR